MRRVDAKETAAVGAQLLDGNLAGCRPKWHNLIGAADGVRSDVFEEGLWHALPHQKQRQHQAERQQAVECGAGQIDPEVADAIARTPGDAAAEHHQHGQTDCRADEVLHAQANHLAEIAHLRFAAIRLPVGIGDETHGGVERQRPLQPRQLLRVERQTALQHQDGEQRQQTDQGEGQQRQAVGFPVLLAVAIDTGNPVAQPLDRLQHGAEPGFFALHHPVQVTPDKGRRQQNQGEERQDQSEIITVHMRSYA